MSETAASRFYHTNAQGSAESVLTVGSVYETPRTGSPEPATHSPPPRASLPTLRFDSSLYPPPAYTPRGRARGTALRPELPHRPYSTNDADPTLLQPRPVELRLSHRGCSERGSHSESFTEDQSSNRSESLRQYKKLQKRTRPSPSVLQAQLNEKGLRSISASSLKHYFREPINLRIPLAEEQISDAAQQSAERFMRHAEKQGLQRVRNKPVKVLFRISFNIALAVIVYFLLVGYPLWDGLVLAVWSVPAVPVPIT